jgi:hypothetical protein
VDPGFVVDPERYSALNQPSSPDQPRKFPDIPDKRDIRALVKLAGW